MLEDILEEELHIALASIREAERLEMLRSTLKTGFSVGGSYHDYAHHVGQAASGHM